MLVLIASGAAGTLLGLYVPKPSPRLTLSEPPPPTPKPPEDHAAQQSTGTESGHASEHATPSERTQPDGRRVAWIAAIAGIGLLAIVTLLVLLAVLPRATSQGAQAFHWGSLGLVVATVAFAAFAFTRPPGKQKGWVLAAVVSAILAMGGNTASGFFVARLTEHSTPRDCLAFFVQLDQLIDDEPGLMADPSILHDPRTATCRPPLAALAAK